MIYLILLGRVLYGGFFLKSGLKHFMQAGMLSGYAKSKKVPAPGAANYLSGLLIALGGIGIILGVYVQYSVACIAVFLVLVTFMVHDFWNEKDAMMKMSSEVNFWKNLALLGAALMFLAIPTPWAMSIG